MRLRLVALAALLLLTGTGGHVRSQPLPPPYVPAPNAGIPLMPSVGYPLPPIPPSVPGYRPSAYRWQYYERNYAGFLRPIVIQTRTGGYYLHNGAPFPWVNVYPGEHWMPLAADMGSRP